MGSVLVVISDMQSDQALQMPLAEHDDVIEQFAAQRVEGLQVLAHERGHSRRSALGSTFRGAYFTPPSVISAHCIGIRRSSNDLKKWSRGPLASEICDLGAWVWEASLATGNVFGPGAWGSLGRAMRWTV
jgi:hypothetical protein